MPRGGRKITTGYSFGLTIKEATAARMLAEGKDLDYTAVTVWCDGDIRLLKQMKTDKEALKKVNRARAQLRKWMKDDRFQECYRAIIKEVVWPTYAEALYTIKSQLGNENGWLANKAANDIMGRFHDSVMGKDESENTVVIKLDGAPELGAPKPSDDDAEADPDGGNS